MNTPEIYVISAVRSAIGTFGGTSKTCLWLTWPRQ